MFLHHEKRKIFFCELFTKRESLSCEFYITIGTVCILNLIISNILINIEGFFHIFVEFTIQNQ